MNNYDSAKKEFCKKILSLSSKYGPTAVFADAVAMMAYSFHNAAHFRQDLEDKYMGVAKKYGKEELEQFAELLGLIVKGLEERFCDFLGECYMKLGQGNKHAGQFFTPYDASRFCAELAYNEASVKRAIEERGYVSIHEPACGSGGMIVAMLEVLKARDINFQRQALIVASDIDSRCAHMCYVTLSLLGAPAIVRIANTLTNETYDTLYTPFYVFNSWRFNRRARAVNEREWTPVKQASEPMQLTLF